MNATILYIDQSNYYGGGQKIAFSVLKYFKKNGWNIIVMFPDGGNLKDIVFNEKFKYIPLPDLNIENGKKKIKDYYLYIKNENKSISIISETIKHYDCDIIYTLSPRLLRIIYKSSKAKCTPIVFHFEMLYNNMIWEKYFKYYFKKSNIKRIIALSDFCYKWLVDKVIKSDKVVTINNWVVESDANADNSKEFSLPSTIAKSFKYAVIGRILTIKGQKTFIEAALHQCEIEKQTEYYVIGDTTFGNERYKKDLHELVKKSKFSSRIHFVDFLKEIACIYRSVDCVVVPSIWNEPFGLVAIEAMYYETPVIVSNRGELPNIVGNGQFGVIFRAGDHEDLLRKMIEIKEDQSTMHTMIKSAKENVNIKFNEATQTINIYEQIKNVL